ncbi:MAG: glycosyltransferase [Saccharofermentans sp.]|nr:glycosyltransferase [Saccharofermentans sp.]
MSDKLVSICIPTYNGGQFIRETLESIKALTYDNIEVIVTDDCSADDTLDICREYDFVKIFINEERQGLVGNWNMAVSKSSGYYIKVIGQDDLLAPNSISKQVEALEQNPSASISIGDALVINQDSEVLLTRSLYKKDCLINGETFARKSLWSRNIFCEPANALYTRSAAQKAGPYSKDFVYVPDWDYGIELCLQGDLCYIAEPIMSFRISSNSETSNLYKKKRKIMLLDTERMFSKYKSRLKLSIFREIYFKSAIRILMHVRQIIIKFKK